MSLRKQVILFPTFWHTRDVEDIGHTMDWSIVAASSALVNTLSRIIQHRKALWMRQLSCLREVIEFGKTEAIALIHCLFQMLPNLIIVHYERFE